MNNKLIVIFITLIFALFKVESQITKISPSFILAGTTPTTLLLSGSNFGLNPVVTVGGNPCNVKSGSSDILIQCQTTGPVNVPSTSVVVNSLAPFTLPVFKYNSFTQFNEKVYIYGDFMSIQSKLLSVSCNGYRLTGYFLNSTTYTFDLVKGFIESTKMTDFYDDTTTLIFSQSMAYSSVVVKSSLTFNQIILEGYNLSPLDYVNVGTTPCQVESNTGLKLVCLPPTSFFSDKITNYTMSLSLKTSTIVNNVIFQRPLFSYISALQNFTTIQVENYIGFENNLSKLSIMGLLHSPTPIVQSSSFKVYFPKETGICGYAYIADTSNPSQILRVSNTILLCPRQLMHGTNIPNNDDGVLSIYGSYLNTTIYGSTEKSMSFSIIKNGIATQTEPQSITYTDNLYFLRLPIPQGPESFVISIIPIWDDAISSSLIRFSPSLSSITRSRYNVSTLITIKGTGFITGQIDVSIGNGKCSNVSFVDSQTLTCLFDSTPIPINGKLMSVFVIFKAGPFSVTKEMFEYICTNDCINGGCSPVPDTCVCASGWSGPNCVQKTPIIVSISSTVYQVPATVTIVGNNFFNVDLRVEIVGSFTSICGDALASQDTKSITCLFKSDIKLNYIGDALHVVVYVNSTMVYKQSIFTYIRPDECPIGSNGQVCSGHGSCNQQQTTCTCEQGWETNDCSVKSLGGVGVTPPIVNENNTTSTIVTPNGNKFDIGIAMINELDSSNSNIIQSYNINNIKWKKVVKDNNTFIYSTELPNKSTLQAMLTINDKDERVYFNFGGDIIPILPKSIKYQIELYNWTFGSTQNNVEIIFKSGLTLSNDECNGNDNDNKKASTQSIDNSVRNIQITVNGETLIGTFSDRMILDGRPTYNKVNKLTTDQISKYQLDSTAAATIYTSILTSYFNNSVIVDPNFGVLISSTTQGCATGTKGLANWKIAVIIVCSIVGTAILVTTIWLVVKQNHGSVKIIALKLKRKSKS
ncbi:hypothetical protein CYY_009090 [Polysphondylium violaceum]|uniref:EGF-like domain-containing protein n=1 Tax=Polysphondylium violaceum TaxID=133409 RepID=A0A8J4V3C2_9MYCE|nr:hypothetical protein CYY_009090 [Polysphondylium violaceum]